MYMGLIRILSTFLTSRSVWILIALIVFALILIYKIRQWNQPFEGTGEEGLEPLPEDIPSLPQPQDAVSQPAPHIELPKTSEPAVDAKDSTSRIVAIEDSIKHISSQIEQLVKNSSKPQETAIPKQSMQIIETLPGLIEQLKRFVSAPKPSGPPVESPIMKEIAASIVSLQKQLSIISSNITEGSGAKGGGGVLPQELLKKLESLSDLKNMTNAMTPFFQKFQGLNSQIDTITILLDKVSKVQSSATKGISPETLANLMVSIDNLKAQMETQEASDGGSQQDFKPMVELFTKQMEDFQNTIQDLKKSLASGSGAKGGAVQDVSNLLNAMQELRTAFTASINAEEDVLSRITTKLDIIHQVITSQTIAGGGGGSAGGDKDIF